MLSSAAQVPFTCILDRVIKTFYFVAAVAAAVSAAVVDGGGLWCLFRGSS